MKTAMDRPAAIYPLVGPSGHPLIGSYPLIEREGTALIDCPMKTAAVLQ